MDATFECMFHQAGANASSCPLSIGGELAEKEAGNRIGRLPGADRAWQDRRNDGGRCQTIISDDTSGIMDDENRRKAPFLIG